MHAKLFDTFSERVARIDFHVDVNDFGDLGFLVKPRMGDSTWP